MALHLDVGGEGGFFASFFFFFFFLDGAHTPFLIKFNEPK